MKTKVTYSEVKTALEAGFVSPLNNDEKYVEVEFAGYTDIELPAQAKMPASTTHGIIGLYDWFNVSSANAEKMAARQKYTGRVVNGEFLPKAA